MKAFSSSVLRSLSLCKTASSETHGLGNLTDQSMKWSGLVLHVSGGWHAKWQLFQRNVTFMSAVILTTTHPPTRHCPRDLFFSCTSSGAFLHYMTLMPSRSLWRCHCRLFQWLDGVLWFLRKRCFIVIYQKRCHVLSDAAKEEWWHWWW